MWMSEAWSWIAWLISRLTNRTIGAASSSASATGTSAFPDGADDSSTGGGQVAELAVGADEAVDRALQVGALGDDRAHLHLHVGAHVVEREHVLRIGHREQQAIALASDRQHVVATQQVQGHQRDRGAIDRVLVELHERQTELRSARRGDLALGQDAVLNQLAGHGHRRPRRRQ